MKGEKQSAALEAAEGALAAKEREREAAVAASEGGGEKLAKAEDRVRELFDRTQV